MTLFEAYVTNAGKYADYGVEVGEPLKFPTTTEEVQALLKRIGVDGVRCQEYFIISHQRKRTLCTGRLCDEGK